MEETGKGRWTQLYLNSPSFPQIKLVQKIPPGIPHFFLTSLGWFHWQTHSWFLESCHRHWVNGRRCWSFEDNGFFPIGIRPNFFSMVPVTWLIFYGWIHQHVLKFPLQLLFASIPHNLRAQTELGHTHKKKDCSNEKGKKKKNKQLLGTRSFIWLPPPTKTAGNKFHLVTTINTNCNVKMFPSSDSIPLTLSSLC